MKKLSFIILGLVAAFAACAQKSANKPCNYTEMLDKQIEAVKQQQILDDSQFAKFESIYRKYDADKRALKSQNKKLYKQCKGDLSEEQTKIKMDSIYLNKQKIADLQQVYYNSCMQEMTAKQFVQVKQTMKDFKKQLLAEYGKNQEKSAPESADTKKD